MTNEVFEKDSTMIIFNGSIHTANEENEIVEAVYIVDNKIRLTGTNEEILKLKGPTTVMVDAKFNSVIPGINDSHNHMWETGILLDGIVTLGIESIEELKLKIKEKLSSKKPGEWLHGGSWIETQFKEKRMITKHDLDEVSPDNPVVLERIFSTCVCNSKALEKAGITKDTPDPEGGEVGRDEKTGEPNGLLFRTAKQLVRNFMDSPFGSDPFKMDPRLDKIIEDGINYYLSFGITSVVEPGVTPAIMKSYMNLKKSNKLKIRTNLMPNWHGFAINETKDFSNRLIKESGFYTGFGDEWLRIGALKMAIDGGLTSKTQFSSWAYKGEDNPRPTPFRLDLDKLNQWVKEAHDSGWAVGIHVMGDLAIERAVDAMYEAFLDNPVIRRHQVIHSYYPTDDSLKKMAEMGVVAALQPAFIYNEADGYYDLLPEERLSTFLPMRRYIDFGVKVAISTDMPSAHTNPFWGLYSALTRKGIQGYQLGDDQVISLDEAIKAMTYYGAYMTEEEHIKGSIEKGKLADLVVLDRNLIQIDQEEIKDTKVIFTIVDGKIVYESN